MSTGEDFDPECFTIDSDEEDVPLYPTTTPRPRTFKARMCDKLSKLFIRQKIPTRKYVDISTVREPDL